MDSTKANSKALFALFLVHFTGDFYNAFLSPLLPALADKLSLSLVQVGLLAGISRLLAFVIQPTAGYLADRFHPRIFIMGGVFLSVVCMPMMGVAPTFGLLMVLVCLGSIGSSMFHPTAAAMVTPNAGLRAGLGMSLFTLGGTAAFALGPVSASWFVGGFGLDNLPWMMIPGLTMGLAAWFLLPTIESENLGQKGFVGSIKDAMGGVMPQLVLILSIIVIRTFISQSIMTFTPILFADRGMDLLSIGILISLYTVAGAISGLIAGFWADKHGYRGVFYFTFILATPCILAYLWLPGYWAFVGSFFSGFFALATLPLAIALAQQLVPKARSLVSSLTMGFAFGVGGILTPITGKLAEMFGLHEVLTVLAFLPLLALVLIRRMPEPPKEDMKPPGIATTV